MASAAEWTVRLAAILDLPQISAENAELLLELSGIAAHAAERTAAPLSCWLVGSAGLTPAEALELIKGLASEFDGSTGTTP